MGNDIEGKLNQLRQLHESGALSDDEYRRARAVIQGRTAPDCGMGGLQDAEARPKPTRTRPGKAAGTKHGGQGPDRARPQRQRLYRDSGNLVIREGAEFPARCVICDKECDGETLDFTFERVKTSHYIEVAAVQTLANAAVDLMKGTRYTGPVRAAIPMCSWHRSRRLQRIAFGVGLMMLAGADLLIRYFIVGAGEFDVLQIPITSVIATLVALVGLTIAWASLVDSTKVWFKATNYYDRFVWVRGAGQKFLRTLPKLEQHHYRPDSANPNLEANELIRRGEHA